MAKVVQYAPALETFLRDLRRTIETSPTPDQAAEQVAEMVRYALRSPQLSAAIAAHVPALGQQTWDKHVFYEDPELRFIVSSTIEQEGMHREPHDHGDCWAVYGTVANAFRVNRYLRADGGLEPAPPEITLEQSAEVLAGVGEADVILPGGIHETFSAGPGAAVNFIVRCHDLTAVVQNRYDLARGTYKRVDRGTNAVLAQGAVRLER